MALILEHPLLREVVDVSASRSVEQSVEREAARTNRVREAERVIRIHVCDFDVAVARLVHVENRTLAGFAARALFDNVAVVVDYVRRVDVRGRKQRIVTELSERRRPAVPVHDTELLAGPVEEDVLVLRCRPDAEWRAVQVVDLLSRSFRS